MKIFLTAILFLFSLFSFAQDREPVNINVFDDQLCQGDRLDLGSYAVVFCEVVSDSRCPKGVECIWAGEAKVKLEFFEGDTSLGTRIISSEGISLAETFKKGNFHLKGFELSPYPDIREKTNPKDYTLWLRFSEEVKSN